MEYIGRLLVFISGSWWALPALLILVSSIYIHFHGWSEYGITLLVMFVVAWLIFHDFSRILTAPIVNHYGEMTVAKVTSERLTDTVDAVNNPISSLEAEFVKKDGEIQQIAFTSAARRHYPRPESFGVPRDQGELFIIKYLPSLPSDFIFITALSEEEKQAICPVLNELAISTEEVLERLKAEGRTLNKQVYQGVSGSEEYKKISRKIRRGKDLTPAEQRLKEVEVERNEVSRRLLSIKRLIEGDNYCAE